MAPKHAALLLLLTAIGGQVLLRVRGARDPEVKVEGGPRTGAVTGQRGRAATHTAEVRPGERIDVDRASAAELARLPGVGRGMAQRIVAERAKGGPFGGRRCLDERVAGIGEGFFRKAGAHLEFSAGGCSLDLSGDRGEGGGREGGGDDANGCPAVVDLNEAGREELECLPGIGRARAESILVFRARRRGFRGVDDLGEVSGVPRGVVEGLRGRVSVGRVP